MHDQFHWARILSFVTGLVNQELLLRGSREHLLSDAVAESVRQSGRAVSR
jgi:hypothetical protein